jgi:tetratricopeptide (TPR) repeat protein/tRNA A-37 threonylcarbamoyl transferase component Bud32
MNITSLSAVDEDARRRFEAAWRASQPEPIERFLPSEEQPDYLATLEELIHIELEMAWKRFDHAPTANGSPRPPIVEHYLLRFPCLNDPAIILRLLRQEFLVRHRHGDRPNPAEYQARFPQFVATGQEVETLVHPGGAARGPVPVLPGYEILGELGHGGMGVVYKARQLNLNRIVALKMILPRTYTAREDLARFRIEAEAVAHLQHPNIVQIHDVGEHDGRPFCALEFIDGGSLAQKLAGTPQAARAAAGVVEQLARAMDWAHQRGILHRDLKPANVLLTTAGLPKISDFGLAKRLESDGGQTQSGAILGTPSYMAPEQAASGKRPVGPATDVYGLGAILYEMLTGRPPFKGESVLETVQQVLADEPVPPSRLHRKVPRDLETICLKCLYKEPKQRYTSAADLANDLGRFLRGEPILARPIGRVGHIIKWVKRRPASAGALALAVLLITGSIAAVFLWQHLEQSRQLQELVYERDRQQQQQHEAERLAVLRRGAVADASFALQELQADRFEEAERILRRALQAVGSEPALSDLKTQLVAKHDRAYRLARFYRLIDRGERLAFVEADNEALVACQGGLRAVGVLAHRQDWWDHLPEAELHPRQRAQLQKDVNAALVLWGSLRVKQGLLLVYKAKGQEKDRVRAKVCFGAALELLPLVQDSGRWQVCRLLRSVCLHNLQKADDQPRRQRPRGGPLNGYDYFGMGIAHLWIATQADKITRQRVAELDVITRAMIETFVGRSPDLDLKTPRATAEALLRKAVELEPKHYWTHLWLGWSFVLSAPWNPYAADMAFSKCIELRPNFGFAYGERGLIRMLLRTQMADSFHQQLQRRGPYNLANWSSRFATGQLMQELERCALRDVEKAVRCHPHDPSIHWNYARVLMELQDYPQILKECARVVELEAPLRGMDGRNLERNGSMAESVQSYLAAWSQGAPNYLDAWAVLAQAYWVLDQPDAALAAAAKVLKENPGEGRALAVRGTVSLQRGQVQEALGDFDAALKQQPTSYLAGAGRARALELLGRIAEALKSYTDLLGETPGPDWQLVEAHLGRARALAALGRTEEARRALAEAEELAPGISEEVAKEVFR